MKIEERFYAPKEIIVKNGGILACSLSYVYALIRRKKIPALKLGRRFLISYKFLEKLMAESALLNDFADENKKSA